jgi:hypothetical protein
VEIEFVITVEGLSPEDRDRFLRGLTNSLYNSKTCFEPPHEWNIRPLSDRERELLRSNNND